MTFVSLRIVIHLSVHARDRSLCNFSGPLYLPVNTYVISCTTTVASPPQQHAPDHSHSFPLLDLQVRQTDGASEGEVRSAWAREAQMEHRRSDCRSDCRSVQIIALWALVGHKQRPPVCPTISTNHQAGTG